jgi:HSP20 family protein
LRHAVCFQIAELPSLDEKDIDIRLTKDSLVIKGENREEHEERKRDYYRMERAPWTRTV